MNIKQLKYVCDIVDSGSFSSAAAREGVSVQAVSKSMAELEGKLGTPLFERLSAGVRPTPFGRAFDARARRVLAEWDALERFCREGTEASHPARMGFVCPIFPGVERYRALINLVSRKALGREAEVVMLDGTEALEALRSGRVDALFTIGQLRVEGVTCGSLGTVATSVLMASDHPLAEHSRLTLDELAPYPVLVSRRFDHFNESVLKAYLARGLRSSLVDVGTPEELEEHFANKGISFLAVGNLVAPSSGLVTRPLFKADEVVVPLCLSTLRGSAVPDYVEFRRALAATNLIS